MMLDATEVLAQKNNAYYNTLAERAQYETNAFSELYDYFFPRVYNFIFSRVKNVDRADDVISITFEKVFLHLAEFDKQKGSFSTWLFQIAIHEMNNLYRKDQRLKETTWEEYFDPADDKPNPEEQLITNERDKQLLLAMEQLATRERCIVTLKYFTQVSNKEIAELKGLTPSNVGVILYRALDKLKKILLQNGFVL